MTLDQIEAGQEGRRNGVHWQTPVLSLMQAARKTGLVFEQCKECLGAGYTKATLLDTPKQIALLAKYDPHAAVRVQYERCSRCDGAGGFVHD